MQLIPAGDVSRLADQYFPLQADGTRRSRPQYFDGAMRDGVYTYGVGAFISRAKATPAEEMKGLVASFQLVSNFGQAARADYDNFYFFTPKTRLVRYGPDRPDRLMFYRHDAPASLDISKEEIARLTLPAADPTRATRCTNLQRLIQDTHGERLATACVTPAYVDGRYVGAFGSSMDLTGFFQDAITTTLPGAAPLIITDKGGADRLSGLRQVRQGVGSDRRRIREEPAAQDAWSRPSPKTGARTAVVTSPDGGEIVAFGRLTGPNWYLLLTYPKSLMLAERRRARRPGSC